MAGFEPCTGTGRWYLEGKTPPGELQGTIMQIQLRVSEKIEPLGYLDRNKLLKDFQRGGLP